MRCVRTATHTSLPRPVVTRDRDMNSAAAGAVVYDAPAPSRSLLPAYSSLHSTATITVGATQLCRRDSTSVRHGGHFVFTCACRREGRRACWLSFISRSSRPTIAVGPALFESERSAEDTSASSRALPQQMKGSVRSGSVATSTCWPCDSTARHSSFSPCACVLLSTTSDAGCGTPVDGCAPAKFS